MSYLSIKNVSKKFNAGDADEVVALDGIILNIDDNEFICLVGPSGCGKTTLLRIIAGLETATSGTVVLTDHEITDPDPERGMVFQEYSLFPWMTVAENVAFGLEMKGIDKETRTAKALEFIELVGLKQFQNSYPHELSGGMRQRVAIARALATDPAVLLMDEPFGALDARTRNTMQRELLAICERTKKTVLFVTHSVDEAVFLSDRVIIMSARPGKIQEIVEINLPRPRDRTAPDFGDLRRHILNMMGEQTS